MKILIFIGTRPEAIKMAPLISLLSEHDSFDVVLCSSGQHRLMLDQVLEIFSIIPKYDLDLMSDNQTLFSLSAKLMSSIEHVFELEEPDLALVHGDTTTAMIASLASFYKKVPVGHVEAGLRTHDKYSPFPEEVNRQLISKLANFHFAPTILNEENLLREGITQETIFVTGNTVIDSIHSIIKKIDSDQVFKKALISTLIEELQFDPLTNNFILITGHRRENFGKGIENICNALLTTAKKYPHIYFVYPVHLNPNIEKPVLKMLSNQKNIKLIKPMPYDVFCFLLQNCYFVLTDSGGIQEEAPSLGKPVIVMRENSERPEAVEVGTVNLVGTSPDKIIKQCSKLIDDKSYYKSIATKKNPYGDGTASRQIVDAILNNIKR